MLLASFCLLLAFSEGFSQTRWITVFDRYGNPLRVEETILTGAAHRVWDIPFNISRYGAEVSQLTEENIETVCRNFLADYQDVIKIKPQDLVLKRARHSHKNWYIHFQQSYEGIPVYRTPIGFTINRWGKIPLLGADIYPDISVSTSPTISQEQAIEIAEVAFRTAEMDSVAVLNDVSLMVYPRLADSISYHLVYEIKLLSEDPLKEWIYFVDAHHGEIVHSRNAILEGDWRNYGWVNWHYWPEHYYDSELNGGGLNGVSVRVVNVGGQTVGQDQTNSNGYYNINWSGAGTALYYLHGAKELSLSSSWVKITNADTKTHSYGPFFPSTSYRHDWSWATDETNVYRHVNFIHNFFKVSPFNYDEMDYQMEAKVHAGDGYNGASNGVNIFFGSQGGMHWARSSDVVYHEYTHCVVYHLYHMHFIDDGNRRGQDYAMDEGFADYFACTINDDPIQGESVGVNRNLDNNLRFPEDTTGEGHHDGQIMSGACWDMRESLSDTMADVLIFKALWWEPQADNFNDFGGNVLLADDDRYGDGDMGNGTPHEGQINAAFEAHGITPTVVGVDDWRLSSTIPNSFSLAQNFPNPFNPTTEIRYSVPVKSRVNLAIYNLLGQRVKTLIDGDQEEGIYSVSWKGENDMGGPVASGVYFYRIQAGDFISTRRMLLLR